MSVPEPPLPAPDERSAPFFEGMARGVLRLQRCACGVWHFPVRTRCGACGGTDLAWADASGRGRLYSHGVLRRAGHPGLAARLPVTLVTVDLEEGVRMSARMATGEAGPLRAGIHVRADFEALSEDALLPVFRIVREE